jgi:transglutaminase-like putative cysteine protease
MLTAALALTMAAAGCATFTNFFSMHYAIDKDGQLFMAIQNTSTQALNKEGVAVRTIIIGGVNYPYSMVQRAPSGQEKTAVHTNIRPNAPTGWTLYVPGKFLIYPKRPAYTQPAPPPRPNWPQPTPQENPTVKPQPTPQENPTIKPRPIPQENPTITPEELEQVELAYAETVRDIEQRGRRLYIHNRLERAAFIQRWQGQPDTAQADAARQEAFPYYITGYMPRNTGKTMTLASETDIVAMARKEPNDFRKVRMIHDWVADIFAYDYDYLWWMENISGQNRLYTLGTIVELERGVCFEYAILFWFLMDASGIETYLISEVIDPENAHAYNMVVINGTGYIIDTTWDSGNKYINGAITKWDMMYRKTYFMSDIAQSYQLRGDKWK